MIRKNSVSDHRIAAALLACALLCQPLAAQRGTPVADVVVNMQGIDIAAVAEQISRITGRTLILDPAVRGTVNVTSADPLTPDGVWDLFQSVLRAQGFVAVRNGRVWRIIPQANAAREAGASQGMTSGQGVVTRMIRLRNVPSEAAARVFKPLVASFGTVDALAVPNAIVVTDYADNARRIERLALALDSGAGADFQSVRLQHASAQDVAGVLQDTLGEANGANGFRAVADERGNIVIIRGDPGAIAQGLRLIRTLDQPGGATPVTRMFRLRNGDAESVTSVLRGVLGDQSAAVSNPVARSLARTTRRGTRLPGSTGSSALPASAEPGVANDPAASPQAPAATDDGARAATGARGFSTPDLTIQPAPELNAIVVRGTPAAIASIEPLISDLDVRRPQVLIEAAIVEINSDDAEALAVQLGIGGAAAQQRDGFSTSFTTLGLPLSSILSTLGAPAAGKVLADGATGNVRITDDFSILVQALGQSTKANLLSTPSLTTLDNQPAEIVVGQNVPFRTGSFATDGNTLTPFTTIERQDVGITLRVLPRVHDGDVVRLEVSQEVSSLTNATVSGAADLITNRRSIETTVLADNGGTIVLGGLITDDRTSTRNKTPILGDIPLVGELFRGRKEGQLKRTLFVFLRPTILRDRTDVAKATDERYGRLRQSEAGLSERNSLLLEPPRARLTVELPGIY
jgi:general secretion pathway protein D